MASFVLVPQRPCLTGEAGAAEGRKESMGRVLQYVALSVMPVEAMKRAARPPHHLSRRRLLEKRCSPLFGQSPDSEAWLPCSN